MSREGQGKDSEGIAMATRAKPRFTVLRGLGILVGLLFVLLAPFIAGDEGVSTFDGIAHLLINVVVGVLFITYGITGASNLAMLSPQSRQAVTALAVLLQLVLGVYLLVAPDRSTVSCVVGAILLVCGIAIILTAYANRRSKPAA